MTVQTTTRPVRFAIPKGRMYDGVSRLLTEAGLGVRSTSRDYRPAMPIDGFDVKTLKPIAIVEMLDSGARDLGFAGADWVEERGADLIELLDTDLDRVRLVAAAPASVLTDGQLPSRRLVVASEYEDISRRWIERRGLNASLLRSYGATEVLPPEDADCIVDNTATGSTLRANNLQIIDELMVSTTRLYASREAMDDEARREPIEAFAMLIQSVLDARKRVMLEINVSADRLAGVIETVPCMREPTVAPMHGSGGFAVKAAVLREDLPALIPAVKARGGTDIVVTTPEQIVR